MINLDRPEHITERVWENMNEPQRIAAVEQAKTFANDNDGKGQNTTAGNDIGGIFGRMAIMGVMLVIATIILMNMTPGEGSHITTMGGNSQIIGWCTVAAGCIGAVSFLIWFALSDSRPANIGRIFTYALAWVSVAIVLGVIIGSFFNWIIHS